MSFFAVEECELKGCQNWRLNNKCAKNQMYIPAQIVFLANIHDSETCQIRDQLNQYRLTTMLEE